MTPIWCLPHIAGRAVPGTTRILAALVALHRFAGTDAAASGDLDTSFDGDGIVRVREVGRIPIQRLLRAFSGQAS